MNIKRQLSRTITILAVCSVVFLLTDPTSVPVLILIVPFVLIFLLIMNLWRLVTNLWVESQGVGPPGDMPRKRSGMVLGLMITLILVLQSLGQLTLRDIFTIGILSLIGYFYATRLMTKGSG